MKFVSTPKSAAFAGAWTGLGFSIHSAYTKMHPPGSGATDQLIFMGFLMLFFFIPTFAFVLGSSDDKAPVRQMPRLMLRGLIWMLCAAIVLAVGVPLSAQLHAR